MIDTQLLFITYEAWFYFRGHVNTQNVQIWSDKHHVIQQLPLHSIKVGVWCTKVHGKSLSQYFSEN
jgi:hypothetical protein